MDIRKVKKLIELLEESGMAEIEITEGDDSVRIVRTCQRRAADLRCRSRRACTGCDANAAPRRRSYLPGRKQTTSPAVTSSSAPMVGTFYRAPAPGSPPFVDIGKEVAVGDIVCIIEAMKMMNQIEADRAGRIKEIPAIDGDPVEFGQPLFIIE